ncbi:MAG: DUF1700 domain-containing protein [Clostridiales Family XIII bacterium]|jgi:uncharacterized membrane protein|nr:DUF1700 domain-containing protein [Clostridiales Family XIII bacterium]
MRKYTGYSYVKKLERCLRKMPYEERLDAVNYYSEYLADAGPEREQEVITRLGPPQRVAAEIRADAALRELNAKAEIAESVKARRKERKANKKSGYAVLRGQNAKAENENGYAGTDYAYGSGEGNESADYGAGYDANQTPEYDYDAGGPEDESAESPNMGESFSAAGLGVLGMLSMPVARPLAVLACVLGIIGLIMGVIVVVVIYAVAGTFAAAGVAVTVVSGMIAPQDLSVMIFLVGGGMAFIGAGLLIGALNYMLGRAIFKGIANLSGRIRHKRVKVRKEIFNYTYTGAGRDYSHTNGNSNYYTTQQNAGTDYPYTDGNTETYTAQPDAEADYPYTDGSTEDDSERPDEQPAQDIRVEDRPAP